MTTGRVLIVDDELMMRRMLAEALAPDGYDIREAADGEAALAAAAGDPPDVILLDVLMPKLSGHDVCRRLRANSATAEIPIILVTSMVSATDLEIGYDAGPDEILPKPPTALELRARVRAMLRLKRYADEARATLRQRETMTEFLVHDLRNPLMTIKANCNILAAGEPLTPLQTARVHGIEAALRRLEGYCRELLATSRLECRSMPIERDACDLVQLAREVIVEQEPLARERRHRIEIDAAAAVVASVDRSLCHRLLENLLVNAIKYSPGESTVVLRVTQEPSDPHAAPRTKVSVLDQGEGIAAEHRTAVFDKYQVIDAKKTAGAQVGLGLYFCRLVAEAHGGRIWVEGNEPTGSIFNVEL